MRLAVPGDFEALTLSAWVRVKGLDRKFNSLLMCDGFEPGTIHWLIRNLSGSLDEFELFSRALTNAELRELYAKGKAEL